MIYPFVENPISREELENLKPYKAYKLLEEKGGYKNLSKEEKEFIDTYFNELWHSETYRTGRYKIMGWILDFSDHLKTYLVKQRYDNKWSEIKAFNKTCIRKNATFPSRIIKIIEI